MSAANRRRGHDAERAVAKYLRSVGFVDAETTRSRLGHDGFSQRGDVSFHPLIVLEVKDVKASAWPTWCRQAAKAAGHGQLPVVVRRTRGEAIPGAWECRFRLIEAAQLGLGIGATYAASVDGEPWVACWFGDLVTAVRMLDEDAA